MSKIFINRLPWVRVDATGSLIDFVIGVVVVTSIVEGSGSLIDLYG